jgi:hypothetical protein
MRIKGVDQREAERTEVPGALGRGKTRGVHFGGGFVEFAYGDDKTGGNLFPIRIDAVEKTGGTNPESEKIKIDIHLLGQERNLFVQRVFDIDNGNVPQQRALVLDKEKIMGHHSDADATGFSERTVQQTGKEKFRRGLLRRHGLPPAGLPRQIINGTRR